MPRPSCARLAAGAALLVLAACANLQKNVPKTSKADPTQAYVAGRFEEVNATFGFSLHDAKGVEYRVTFKEDRTPGIYVDATQRGVVGLTAIPPGDYRVSGWIHDTVTKPLREDGHLSRPFHVDAGHIVFLGSFDATVRTWTVGNMLHTEWSLDPKPIRADEVVTVVRGAYPASQRSPQCARRRSTTSTSRLQREGLRAQLLH